MQACEYYRHCVEELAAVERHLLQAKARALTEREKKLSEKKQALCGYDETINLPTGIPLAYYVSFSSWFSHVLQRRNHRLVHY